MTQAELIDKVSELSTYPKVTVKDVLNSTFNTIRNTLAEGEEVQIHQFGIFRNEIRKPRGAYNPIKGETMELPETNVVKFTPSKTLKRELSEVKEV